MAYTVQDLAPIMLGQCGRKQQTLSAEAVISAFNNITEGLDLVLAASQAEGRMFVFKDGTKYVSGGEIRNYRSLADAMAAERSFGGYAYVAEDIGCISAFSGTPDTPFAVSRRLILDFNGRRVSVGMASDPGNTGRLAFMLLSSNAGVMGEEGLPDVTLRNGEMFSSSDGRMFVVYQGSLKLENMKVELDCSEHATGNSAAVIRMNGSLHKQFQQKAYASVDKDTEIVMTECGKAPAMFQLFSSYFRLKGSYTKEQWIADLELSGLTEEGIAPEIFIDGRCVQTAPDGGWSVVNAEHPEDFDPVLNYPQVTTGNGGDIGVSKIVIGPHAYINAGEGVGIYSGMHSEVRLEGGTIIGGTGIVMRGGTLVVPADSDPVVIGSGPYRSYVPYHSLVRRISGGVPASGSDAQLFLNMGHAVVLENNGNSYGGCPVSAYVGSGRFISYRNTPFGSYGIAKDSAPSDPAEIPAHTFNYNGGTYSLQFEKRLSGFVDACSSNRPPIGIEYDYATGHFPDWQQTASGSVTRSGCQTYRDIPYDESAGELD